MTLFYFALIAGGIVMFFNDTKGLNQLFAAIDTYRKPFKIATLMYIAIMGMLLFPLNFIDFSMISLYAMVYIFVGVIMYGIYKRQPLKVLTIVSLLHVLGMFGRIALEWQSLSLRSMTVINIFIYAAIIPLYIYIIQLVLTLKRFSSSE